MSKVIQLINAINTFGFFSSLLIDSFLIILTHFLIKRDFGQYKWLITSFAVSGVAFTSIEHIVTPILHNYNSALSLFAAKKPFEAPIWVMEILLSVCCGSLSVTISMLAVQFLYRYYAVFGSHKVVYFYGWKVMLWVGYSLFFGLIWTLAAFNFAVSDSFSNAYLSEEMYQYYGVNLTNIASLAMVARDDKNPTIMWKNLIYTFISVPILLIQYIIILYCGLRMNQRVKSKTITISSPTLRRLHRQFFKALVLQILPPSIIIFIPLLIVQTLPFLNCKVSFPTALLTWLTSLYPAADALILMHTVSEYSKAIKCFVTLKV